MAPSPPLDDRTRDEIIRLGRLGRKPKEIVEITGANRETVKTTLRRDKAKNPDEWSKAAPEPAARPKTSRISPAPARVDDSAGNGSDEPVFEPIVPGSKTGSVNVTSAIRRITQESAAGHLIDFIETTKVRAIEAHEARIRAEENRGKDEDPPVDSAWEEVQFLKLYKDGVKMLIDCSGLSSEAVGAPAANPVDAYLEAALKQLKEAGIRWRPSRSPSIPTPRGR